jgi:ferrous iron transport protein B
LGYDWKIGIALITSFCCQGSFVGTMATLYSVGGEKNNLMLKQKMKEAVRADGTTRFSPWPQVIADDLLCFLRCNV